MKNFIAVTFVLSSLFSFSQTRDTVLFSRDTVIAETVKLREDRSSEIIICALSPGVSAYTGELEKHLKENSYFNAVCIGVSVKKISVNFSASINGPRVKNSFIHKNQAWHKGNELTFSFLGFNASYSIFLSPRLILKPFAGASSTSFYLVKAKQSDTTQESGTAWCPYFGMNTEYRFKPKRLYTTVDTNGDIAWANRYWGLQLQTGIFTSVHKKNTGLNGNMWYITIGGFFEVGNYKQKKKIKN